MGAARQSGLIKGRNKALVTLRVRLVGGSLNGIQTQRLGEVAERFGDGRVHLTTRQGVELPGISVECLDEATEALAEVGLTTGSTGPTVRSIVACAGADCRHALIDAQTVARIVDEQLAGRGPLPHKFKIGVTGCPNSCAKPRENDLGIMGSVTVELRAESCSQCGVCLEKCPQTGALTEDMDGMPLLDEAACNRCGCCVDACPSEAWIVRESLHALFVGGRMGRHPMLASRLQKSVRTEAELRRTVDTIVTWYASHGTPKERFAETIERVGMESLVEAVDAVDDGLLAASAW